MLFFYCVWCHQGEANFIHNQMSFHKRQAYFDIALERKKQQHIQVYQPDYDAILWSKTPTPKKQVNALLLTFNFSS